MRSPFIEDVPERIIFRPGAIHHAPAALAAEGASRILLIASERQAASPILQEALGPLLAGTFHAIEPHVPAAVAEAAQAAAREVEADWVLALGGGSAIGAAKAAALTEEVKIAAIPTTYSGSERTEVYGIRGEGGKKTGRDARVRPRLVLYDPELTYDLPRELSLQSLLNALAHSVEALWAQDATDAARDAATRSLRPLITGLQGIGRDPRDPRARNLALYGAYLAGSALGGASVGLHHTLCHVLGGTFHTHHAATHALLLPYVLAFNAPEAPAAIRALRSALHTDDPAAYLYALQRDLGLPTRLDALGLTRDDLAEAAERTAKARFANPRRVQRKAVHDLLLQAWHDRRPSVFTRHMDLPPTGRHTQPVSLVGAPLSQARIAVLAVHGRGADADGFVAKLRRHARRADGPGVAWLGVQADEGAWYPESFAAPVEQNQPWLDDALARLDLAWETLARHVPPERIAVVGFSQGACLLLTWLGTREARPGRILAYIGAHIDLPMDFRSLRDLPVYLSVPPDDPWVSVERVTSTAAALRGHGAIPTVQIGPTPLHAIRPPDGVALVEALQDLAGGGPRYQQGFGNTFATEAVPGALPTEQNSPRNAPWGLYAEQINGTAFTAPRATNQRVWVYRLRPQVVSSLWEAAPGGRWLGRFDAGLVSPQVLRFAPEPLPEGPVDFVQGVSTFAGGGDPVARQGMAIHTWAATADMERSAFVNIDGDLLFAPWEGRLEIRTELGWLTVGPGEIAIVPRGIRMQILLPDGPSRGFLGELFEGHFTLPDRGLIGANGLADARHFEAPVASYEDQPGPYPLLARQGGAFWRTLLPHSPFDVVAWHGNYAPFKYDLRRFQSLGSVSFDHPDPSLLTVLTAPASIGGSAIDVVTFLGRWDPTEHTFRPPFFHRNATIEFNMVLRSPDPSGRWRAGAHTWTPILAPHGVSVAGYRAAIAGSDAVADAPVRGSDDSIWLQFESAYPLRLAPWVQTAAHRDLDYTEDFHGWPVGELGGTHR